MTPVSPSPSWLRREQTYPASPEQQGLWIEHYRAPFNVAYNECLSLDIAGELDYSALQRALAAIVARHSPLRSRFETVEGRVVQVVQTDLGEIPLATVDCAESEVGGRLLDLLSLPFELARQGLWRAALLRVASDRHVLVIVIHHIICDGWSRRIFLDELARGYRTLCGASSHDPPRPPEYSYGDYALDRIAALDERRRAELVRCWHSMFGAAASQALPSPRHAEVAAVGVDYHEFEPGFVAQLAYLARSNACSPFAAVLALIQRQLLERFGIRDIVIATDFAARSDQRLESLIGLFARQLPLPLRTVPNETFSDLARRTQGVIVEAIAAGDLGFAEISSCARDRGVGPPLFALKVVLEQGLRPALELPQLRVSYRADPVAAAKFPLLLNLSLDGDRLACRTEFDPAQIDAGFARTLAPSLSDVAAREFAAAGNNTSATARGGSGPRARYQRRPVALPNATALVRDREHVFPNLLSVFRPASAHADAPVLFAENRDLIREELRAKGAVLVRALAVDSAAELQRLSQSLFGSVLAYTERTSPRSRVDGNIYTSTDYPPEEKLPLHNENAYAASWPRWISFFCVTAPVEGGCTPLADIAEIYDALPGDVRDLFVRRGLQYVRNFNGPLGLSTEAAFGSSDTSAIDRMLRASGYGVERSRGRLTTRRRAPAVRMHPDHGMPVWFNHAHFFSITEKQLTERFALPGHELPTRVLYGDGEEIETRCVAALSEAYAFAERRFAWQKGDLLLLDNMRIAHGRDSFRPPRRIWVAMSEEISDPREDRT